jgi:hypothetical protein
VLVASRTAAVANDLRPTLTRRSLSTTPSTRTPSPIALSARAPTRCRIGAPGRAPANRRQPDERAVALPPKSDRPGHRTLVPRQAAPVCSGSASRPGSAHQRSFARSVEALVRWGRSPNEKKAPVVTQGDLSQARSPSPNPAKGAPDSALERLGVAGAPLRTGRRMRVGRVDSPSCPGPGEEDRRPRRAMRAPFSCELSSARTCSWPRRPRDRPGHSC